MLEATGEHERTKPKWIRLFGAGVLLCIVALICFLLPFRDSRIELIYKVNVPSDVPEEVLNIGYLSREMVNGPELYKGNHRAGWEQYASRYRFSNPEPIPSGFPSFTALDDLLYLDLHDPSCGPGVLPNMCSMCYESLMADGGR